MLGTVRTVPKNKGGKGKPRNWEVRWFSPRSYSRLVAKPGTGENIGSCIECDNNLFGGCLGLIYLLLSALAHQATRTV